MTLKLTFKDSILPLWIPVFVVLGTDSSRQLFNGSTHFFNGDFTGVFGRVSIQIFISYYWVRSYGVDAFCVNS